MSTTTTATKQCRRCDQVKPLTAFYPDIRCRDGVGSRCRTCTAEGAREYERLRRARLEEARQDEMNQTPDRPARVAGSTPQTSGNREEALVKLATAMNRWSTAKDKADIEFAAAAVVFRAKQLLEVCREV